MLNLSQCSILYSGRSGGVSGPKLRMEFDKAISILDNRGKFNEGQVKPTIEPTSLVGCPS